LKPDKKKNVSPGSLSLSGCFRMITLRRSSPASTMRASLATLDRPVVNDQVKRRLAVESLAQDLGDERRPKVLRVFKAFDIRSTCVQQFVVVQSHGREIERVNATIIQHDRREGPRHPSRSTWPASRADTKPPGCVTPISYPPASHTINLEKAHHAASNATASSAAT
jgi:hypothetical protein